MIGNPEPLARILAALPDAKPRGREWLASCPAHDDHEPSLSVSQGDDGRILVHCHAGCNTADVLAALGMKMADLFPSKHSRPLPRPSTPRQKRSFPSAEAATAAAQKQTGGELAGQWIYPGDTFRVLRFDLPNTDPDTGKPAKTFRPIHRNSEGWQLRDPPGPLPLYRSDDLPNDGPVFVLEGEKAVDAARSIGLAAVTSAHGAKSPKKSEWGPLAGRNVIILPDNDEPGQKYAEKVAGILTALQPPAIVRVAQLPGLPQHGDIVDWLEQRDAQEPGVLRAEIMALAKGVEQWKPRAKGADGNGDLSGHKADDPELHRLAALPPIEYDRIRKESAKKLGVRTGTLDAEIAKRRPSDTGGNKNLSGSPLELSEIEPWPEAVSGAETADAIRDSLREFLVLSPLAAEAITLWILRAQGHDLFDYNPRLAFLSPEKRCGKTRTLTVLSLLTPRPLLASNISPATVFRTIEAARPTLLIDELDSFHNGNDELRGILNSGHSRAAAWTLRTVGTGDDFEPRKFSTWAPMALAAIGDLPDTLADRSIIVPMRRKKTGETVKPIRLAGRAGNGLRERFDGLSRKAARWIVDNSQTLANAEPEMPTGMDDRAADNWSGLLAIADALGEEWPQLARQAAITLSGGEADTDTLGTRLLRDIRSIFEAEVTDRLASKTLCERLNEIEDSPWPGWSHGRGMNPHGLARLLKPFNIVAGNLRFPSGICRGYQLADFHDTFDRYLLPTPVNPV